MFWKVRAIPSRVMRCGGSPLMEIPSKRTAPEVNGYRPVMQLKAVVLPAPLGPIMETISPSPTSKERSSTAARLPSSPPLLALGQRARVGTRLQLDLAGSAGQQPSRPQHHDRDQDHAKDDVGVLGIVDV